MNIRINGITIDKWANLSVSLIYDGVGSIFSFDLYWNPFDSVMRDIMLPGAYNECTIVGDTGEILISGVMHSPSFKSSAAPNLVNISGYSRTGVFEDCEYSAVCPAQLTGLTLLQICQNAANAFGFGNVIDNTGGIANKTITNTDADPNQSITSFLASLTKENNIVLSHDANGNIVLSIAGETKPVFDFTSGMPGIVYDLSFAGQQMHHKITAGTQGGNISGGVTVFNPYVNNKFNFRTAAINTSNILNAPVGKLEVASEYNTGFRPHLVVQSTNDSVNLQSVAEAALADELKAIRISIKMNGWELGGKIVRPNTTITILNPEIYLFLKTKLFIESVDFSGDERHSTCVINIVVPEVYNGKPPINIFTNKGNNTIFVPDPGSALQGGFAGQNNFIDL